MNDTVGLYHVWQGPKECLCMAQMKNLEQGKAQAMAGQIHKKFVSVYPLMFLSKNPLSGVKTLEGGFFF